MSDNLQQIFKKYPKAKKSFEVHFSGVYISRHSSKFESPEKAFTASQGRLRFLYKLDMEVIIGYILAWMRSEGWDRFMNEDTVDEDDNEIKECSINSGDGYLIGEGLDFDTAFLSLTEEFCAKIEKQ